GDELADGGQPFAVNQLVAELHLAGDVPSYDDKMRNESTVVGQRDDGAGRRERRPVLAETDEVAAPDPLGPDRFEDGFGLRARLFGEESRLLASDHLRRVVSDSATERAIGVFDDALRRQYHQVVVGLFG